MQILRRCNLFEDLDDKNLEPLAEASRYETFEKGESIFAANDNADGLRVILAGAVRVWLADADGKELTLSFMSEGEGFGEIALLDGRPRTANATAADSVHCLFLPKKAVEHAMDNDPVLTRKLIGSLCKLMRRNLDTISSFAFIGLPARLIQLILDLSKEHARTDGDCVTFTRRFSQSDLANLLGVTREAINKRLKALQFDGLIEFQDNRLVIPDLPSLQERLSTEQGLLS